MNDYAMDDFAGSYDSTPSYVSPKQDPFGLEQDNISLYYGSGLKDELVSNFLVLFHENVSETFTYAH